MWCYLHWSVLCSSSSSRRRSYSTFLIVVVVIVVIIVIVIHSSSNYSTSSNSHNSPSSSSSSSCCCCCCSVCVTGDMYHSAAGCLAWCVFLRVLSCYVCLLRCSLANLLLRHAPLQHVSICIIWFDMMNCSNSNSHTVFMVLSSCQCTATVRVHFCKSSPTFRRLLIFWTRSFGLNHKIQLNWQLQYCTCYHHLLLLNLKVDISYYLTEVEGLVSLVGWLCTEIVYLHTDGHRSEY